MSLQHAARSLLLLLIFLSFLADWGLSDAFAPAVCGLARELEDLLETVDTFRGLYISQTVCVMISHF